MPIIRGPTREAPNTLSVLGERARQGRVLPIISNSFYYERLFGGIEQLAMAWAKDIDYPLADSQDLLEVASIRSFGEDAVFVKRDFLDFVKAYFLYFVERDRSIRVELLEEIKEQYGTLPLAKMLSYANFLRPRGGESRTEWDHFTSDATRRSQNYDELRMMLHQLAEWPLPVYLTTSYHTILEEFLYAAGKNARTEVCRWHKGLEGISSAIADDNYEPSSREPVVFHLYGSENFPSSMVLTEKDYLEFLVSVAADIGRSNDVIPPLIRQHIDTSSHLLLGFRDLSDLEWIGVHWRLRMSASRRLLSVLILPTPESIENAPAEQNSPLEFVKMMSEKQLQAYELKIFWGDLYSFIQQLHEEIS